MRKQYHFQRSARGLLAWEVDRLIALSEGLPVRDVALDTIRELDEVYWFDADQERPTCRRVIDHIRLIERASLDYPIILGDDGRVMDGMHRIAKALLASRTHVCAVRFEEDPPPDHVGVRPRDLPY